MLDSIFVLHILASIDAMVILELYAEIANCALYTYFCIHAFFQKRLGTVVCYLKHNHNDEITDLCVTSLLYLHLEDGICERKLVKLLSVISDHQVSCPSPV